MKRRKFLGHAATAGVAAVAASALSKPAIAQSLPDLNWRLTSSFPKSLDTLFGGIEHFSKRVAEMTGGKFKVRTFAAGEIVPGLQVLDAVQKGTVEAGQTASYYYVGKDPTFAFDCAMPFSMTARQQQAWMMHGGGYALMREFMKSYDVHPIVFGNTGAQMGGWFRKPIQSLADVRNLKFRIAGLAGQVFAKLGAVPQVIAGGEIYPALEKGTIDAAEWVGPYDDEKLGFVKVAPHYHYPGFWEGGTQVTLMINMKHWEALPPLYKQVVETAAHETSMDMLAKYDHLNVISIKKLVASGAKLTPWPRDVLEAAWKASHQLYDEIAAKNDKFKKIYGPWKAYRDDQYQWFRVAELSFANFSFTAAQTVK
jgi:TRAP-type mannitol/chloroaromatic compound transport system substrate-binding protein